MGLGVLEFEIYADGGEGGLFEVILDVAGEYGSFADLGLAYEADFELVVIISMHYYPAIDLSI